MRLVSQKKQLSVNALESGWKVWTPDAFLRFGAAVGKLLFMAHSEMNIAKMKKSNLLQWFAVSV